MFNDLIDRASSLVKRLEVVKKAYDDDELSKLSHSQHIAPAEIDDWFDAAAAITTQAFGKNSVQIQKWNSRRAEIREHDRHEALAGRFNDPVGATIYEIKTMNGMLMGFQDIWNAQQKLRSQAAQASKVDTSISKESENSNKPRRPFYVRLISGLFFAVLGYGLLLLPQIRSWEWLQNHPAKKGLYFAEILVVTAITWVIIDTNSARRGIVGGGLGLAAIVALIQVLGK